MGLINRYFTRRSRQIQYRIGVQLLLIAVCLVTITIVTNTKSHLHYNDKTENKSTVGSHGVRNDHCPGVLSSMTYGQWLTRPLTKKQQETMLEFLANAHVRFKFPSNYERVDGQCGNVTHTGSKTANWFRALCDPRGPRPCCYQNQCVMKTTEECVCENCYDMRRVRHAEFSTWIPSHPGCPYKEHTPEEACRILNGSTVIFAGDSVLRHVYIALLLIITGDHEHGALYPMVDKDVRDQCSGMYMFTEKVCRNQLINRYRCCGNTVELELKYCCDHRLDYTFKRIAESLWKPRSLLIAGMGIHADFDSAHVINDYLLPLLAYLEKRRSGWPRLLWAESHAPGVLKSPVKLSQTYESVKGYNARLNEFLKGRSVSVFPSFNLTDGMMSFDGEHYGMGVNLVKANLLLSYIDELKTKGLW